MNSGNSPAEMLTCPMCGQRYRIGELACPRCGNVFNKGGKTRQITDEEKTASQLDRAARSGHDTSQASVMFQIEGQNLILPIGDRIIVGRVSNIPGDSEPDVDLAPYGADEKGVSRQHLQIRYQGFKTYAADLGSSNGTWLNGQRLTAQTEHLLHDGDELRLGRLKVTVKL
jgi:pSer/pThr/pTyr-binding forkhead associated (FHA) protein